MIVLPQDVLRGQVFQFLLLDDLARLDCAYSNHSLRHHFLAALREYFYPYSRNCMLVDESISWICSRGVQIDCISADNASAKAILTLAKHILKLKEIYIGKRNDLTPAVITKLLKISRDIEIFNVCGFHVTDAVVRKLALGSNSVLRKLHVYNAVSLTDKSLHALAKHCPNLQMAVLCDCSLLTATGITALTRACPKLVWLDILNTCPTNDEILRIISANCPKLQTLEICGGMVTDIGIGTLSSNCPLLRHLRIDGCAVTDEGMAMLASRCLHLERLYIFGCPISSAGMASLASHANKLVELHIESCDEIGTAAVEELSRGCPSLRVLDIHDSCDLFDEGFIAFTASHPGLRVINMHDCSVTRQSLDALAVCCSDLTALRLSYCMNLQTTDLELLVRKCSQLLAIDLGNVVTMLDHDIIGLAEHCRLLQYVSLFNNSAISDLAIQHIVKLCPNLKYLNVIDCSSLSNQAFTEIGQYASNLMTLIAENIMIDDSGLFAIADGCKLLARLNITDCRYVSANGIRYVTDNCKCLKEISCRGCDVSGSLKHCVDTQFTYNYDYDMLGMWPPLDMSTMEMCKAECSNSMFEEYQVYCAESSDYL